jgi:hypothetical protein
MNLLTLFQAVSLISVSLTVIWSLVKITRSVAGLVAFCTRVMREHDILWRDYEDRHGIKERHTERGDAAPI